MATIFEEIKTSGTELVNTVKNIVEEGNVRRIIIKNKKGKTLLEVPLTMGVAGLGAGLFALGPFIPALAFFALFVNDFNIIVERGQSKEVAAEAQIIEIVEDEGPDYSKNKDSSNTTKE